MEVLLFALFFITSLIFFIAGKDDFGRTENKPEAKVNKKVEDDSNSEAIEEIKNDELIESKIENEEVKNDSNPEPKEEIKSDEIIESKIENEKSKNDPSSEPKEEAELNSN